jgi:hypothetical protein
MGYTGQQPTEGAFNGGLVDDLATAAVWYDSSWARHIDSVSIGGNNRSQRGGSGACTRSRGRGPVTKLNSVNDDTC